MLGLGNNVSDSARSWTPGDLPGLRVWYKFNEGLENDAGAFPANAEEIEVWRDCLLYTSPSPRDRTRSRMPSSA